MKNSLIAFIFLFLSAFAFGDEYSLNTFGPVLEIGITRFKGKELFVKSENGSYKLLLDGKEVEVGAGKVSKVAYKNGNFIYGNKEYTKIEIKKADIFALLSISKDGQKYSRYRGEFVLKSLNSQIMPINMVQAEEYLYSVVPSEIGYSFEAEAIKAQAIAARSYLYHSLLSKKYNYCDLLDTVDSQVYLGFDRENDKITELVNETSNLIMVYDGKAINALFHSTSGGRTANNEDVWPAGTPLPYIRGVADKGNGDESPRQLWEFTISKKDFSKKVGFTVNKIEIVERVDGRVKYAMLKGSKNTKVTGNQLRSYIGYNKLFSTMFSVKDTGNSFYFKGNGSGHGLGMPQWSANGLAKKGKKYDEILKYYYSGVSIEKI